MNRINIDFSKDAGKLKPVHGVCNGPICKQGTVDLSRYYREAAFPSVRLHDTDAANSRYYVDVSRIFPNFDADEYDEKNYFFKRTDRLMTAIKNLGCDIIYRLGESIDHEQDTRYTTPPKDFDKWCRICIQIIKHYNEGWSDGFNYDIKYWEIWNEAEGINEHGIRCNWHDGTDEQWKELYKTAVKAIKDYNPALKVGGMAFCSIDDGAREFVKFCRENELPLDFFSYHGYENHIESVTFNANQAKELLDKYGYGDAEILYDEWNYIGFERPVEGDVWWNIRNDDTPELREEVHTNQRNEVGGAFASASLIEMNHCPIDIANYYDAQIASNWCGMFNAYSIPQKPFYAFKAYGDMYKNTPNAVKSSYEGDGIYCIAAVGETQMGVLISSFRGADDYVSVDMASLGEGVKKAEVYIVDKDRNLELDRVEYFTAEHAVQILKLSRYMTVYIKITKE